MTWETHAVTNVVPALTDYNVYAHDTVLREGVRRAAGAHADAREADLLAYGGRLGQAQTLRAAADANRHSPVLERYDGVGNRIDDVRFHPAWHTVSSLLREQGLIAQPFADPEPGAWAAYAAGFSMHGQIEAGSLCPASMTFASIPVLRQQPALFETLQAGLLSRTYDTRDVPIPERRSLLIGMGMTEKQGGSDVRSNETSASPLRGEGPGEAYRLVGHKWFFSAPQSDAHLVVACTPAGMSCFFVPRWRPDGTRNAVRIQRLKDKLGNRSNASSEVEFENAWGVLVGEEGRGIPTILEMATHTRLNCVMGSTGLMRQALVQAIHYARHRSAFGRTLVTQPLMQNVLADMALESEAATLLMLRLTQAFAEPDDPVQRAYRRIVTPAAKLWVCKRAVELAGEAMEVCGGNGYVEDMPLARLLREAPVNSIWEGSGNVMALDVLRAMAREPQALTALLGDLAPVSATQPVLRSALGAVHTALSGPPDVIEREGRRIAQRLVLLVQADLLRRHSPPDLLEAFVASRFDAESGRVFGTLPGHIALAPIIDRAWPA
ncbi:isovaleryl-CoA dehydrogenase [Achromobacter sp. GG226]|uniref:isovaleryl-CoA dehydrogenase n=1 Tax=Verticiella alkaliphila TaxID=2779529 RepID=UPI001C0BDF05|nr:isovaleryl-CoA dehydrogenase [Verticiella sp. GG226]MBU4612160.1 isovaleryl-CoA dehydrogenase [Verticiella sp. GG226]